MSELSKTANDLLVKMIDVTVESVSDVVEFSKQQIPDIIHQLLVWKIAESIVWLVLGALIMFTGAWVTNRFRERMNEDEASSGTICQIIVTIVTAFIGICMIVSNLLDVLYIWLAPKVWLIEYAADLIKGAS